MTTSLGGFICSIVSTYHQVSTMYITIDHKQLYMTTVISKLVTYTWPNNCNFLECLGVVLCAWDAGCLADLLSQA